MNDETTQSLEEADDVEVSGPKASNVEASGGDVVDDVALANALVDDMAKVRAEIAKRIVGQEGVVELVLLTLLCGGNSLLMGVPGLAKTMLVNTVAQALALSFSRIQFTPDLMPSDITGTDLVQENPATAARELKFLPGPVFANIVLADEINRTPPKTQAALLEAMQEHRVTVQGRTYALDEPFFVFATQNPIELEGTYPLPEAQLDRFAFEIVLDYLPEDDELAVVQNTTGAAGGEPDAVIGASALIGYQQLVRRVPAADTVARYALRIVRASRPTDALATSVAQRFLAYGASVRAAQYLVLAGKARALTRGRAHVGFEDIRALALPVLRHRLLRNFKAESEGVTTGQVISDLIANISEPALV